jgi:hypothetical protein
VVRAGETLWEFLVTMICVPDQPMLTLVDDELAQRQHLRGPRLEERADRR